MKKLNAGDRLLRTMKYLKIENQTEFGDLIGKAQGVVSGYLARDKFSDAILRSLIPLEEKGINIKFFSDVDEPMLLKEVVKKELIYDDYLKLKKRVEKQERMIEENKQFKEKILLILSKIENKLDEL